MGEVISIKRSKDNHLVEQFESLCPSVPSQLDGAIRDAASLSLGSQAASEIGPSFKTVCVVLTCACLLGAGLFRGFTTRWHMAVESAAADSAVVESVTAVSMAAALPGDDASRWRRSQAAWAAYIEHLESDPFYQHVLEEKRKYREQYTTE